jgi:hypothetical protein
MCYFHKTEAHDQATGVYIDMFLLLWVVIPAQAGILQQAVSARSPLARQSEVSECLFTYTDAQAINPQR